MNKLQLHYIMPKQNNNNNNKDKNMNSIHLNRYNVFTLCTKYIFYQDRKKKKKKTGSEIQKPSARSHYDVIL